MKGTLNSQLRLLSLLKELTISLNKFLIPTQMTILPLGPNVSRLMSIPTKIDVLSVVVTFVSANSPPKVNFDFSFEKVNRLTFDQKVNIDPFHDDSRSQLISTFRIQICNPRRQIIVLTQIESSYYFMQVI